MVDTRSACLWTDLQVLQTWYTQEECIAEIERISEELMQIASNG